MPVSPACAFPLQAQRRGSKSSTSSKPVCCSKACLRFSLSQNCSLEHKTQDYIRRPVSSLPCTCSAAPRAMLQPHTYLGYLHSLIHPGDLPMRAHATSQDRPQSHLPRQSTCSCGCASYHAKQSPMAVCKYIEGCSNRRQPNRGWTKLRARGAAPWRAHLANPGPPPPPLLPGVELLRRRRASHAAALQLVKVVAARPRHKNASLQCSESWSMATPEPARPRDSSYTQGYTQGAFPSSNSSANSEASCRVPQTRAAW